MQEPVDLTLSSAVAAAQISLALWCSQIFIAILRSQKPSLLGPALIALLTVVSSSMAWQDKSLGSPWQTCWLFSGILAAIMVVVMVSRWASQSSNTPSTSSSGPAASSFILPMTIAVTGVALTLTVLGQTQATRIFSFLPSMAVWCYLATVAVMFGVAIACTLELTIGETGKELLALPWPNLSLPAGVAFLMQIGLGMLVIAKLQPAETPLETMIPVIYSFGLLMLGYITWCIPRRMEVLAKQKATTGQATLALAGWISLLCFALAAAIK